MHHGVGPYSNRKPSWKKSHLGALFLERNYFKTNLVLVALPMTYDVDDSQVIKKYIYRSLDSCYMMSSIAKENFSSFRSCRI